MVPVHRLMALCMIFAFLRIHKCDSEVHEGIIEFIWLLHVSVNSDDAMIAPCFW